MACSCAPVGAVPSACPVVALDAWVTRSERIACPLIVSRPSHMTVLRKARLLVGSGRRYIDAMLYGAPHP